MKTEYMYMRCFSDKRKWPKQFRYYISSVVFFSVEFSNGYFDIDIFIESDSLKMNHQLSRNEEGKTFKIFQMNEVLASFRASQSFDTWMRAYSVHTCPIRVGELQRAIQYIVQQPNRNYSILQCKKFGKSKRVRKTGLQRCQRAHCGLSSYFIFCAFFCVPFLWVHSHSTLYPRKKDSS